MSPATEKSVDECLKSTRFVYQALLVLCATVVIFCLAPDESMRFASARPDLSRLMNLTALFQDYNDYLGEKTDPLVRGAFDAIDAHFQTLPSYAAVPQSGRVDVIWHVPTQSFQRLHRAPTQGTVAECVEFLRHDRAAAVCHAVFHHYAPEPVEVPANPAGETAEPDSGEEDSTSTVPTESDFKVPPHKYLGVKVRQLSIPANETRGFLYASRVLRLDSGTYIDDEDMIFEAVFEPIEQTKFVDFLRLRGLSDAMIEATVVPALPSLGTVWDEIRGRTVADAMGTVSQREKEADETFPILGINLHRVSATLGGIAGILALLVYLLAHVRVIRYLGNRGSVIECGYWLPLFPGNLGKFLGFASIVVLPLIANGMLVYRFWGGWLRVALPIGLAIAASLVGLRICQEVAALRREQGASGAQCA